MPNEFKGGLNRFNPFASYTLTKNRILNEKKTFKNVQKRKIVENLRKIINITQIKT